MTSNLEINCPPVCDKCHTCHHHNEPCRIPGVNSDSLEYLLPCERCGRQHHGSVYCAEKPPIGLMSRDVWYAMRLRDVIGAIGRYHDAGKPIPREWIDELSELNKRREQQGK